MDWPDDRMIANELLRDRQSLMQQNRPRCHLVPLRRLQRFLRPVAGRAAGVLLRLLHRVIYRNGIHIRPS